MPISYVPGLVDDLGSEPSGEADDGPSVEETLSDVATESVPEEAGGPDALAESDGQAGAIGEVGAKVGPSVPMGVIAAVVAVGALIAFLVLSN
jgi:hypothetical protein